jgi:hypothetical protein
MGFAEALGAVVQLVPILVVAAGVTVIVVVTVAIVMEAAKIDATDEPKPVDTDCKQVKERCISSCSSSSLPTGDHGFKFWNCVKRCMAEQGC